MGYLTTFTIYNDGAGRPGGLLGGPLVGTGCNFGNQTRMVQKSIKFMLRLNELILDRAPG